jgi:hypothetical protein
MVDIADCYFTALTNPDAFFATKLGVDAWDDATDANQTKALQMATAKIDSLPLQGYKLADTQARAFPRKYEASDSPSPWGSLVLTDTYGYIYDATTVPQFVLDAVCYEALGLLQFYADDDWKASHDRQHRGVSSASDPSGSESYLAGSATVRYGLKSQEAYDLLSPYIARRGDIR